MTITDAWAINGIITLAICALAAVEGFNKIAIAAAIATIACIQLAIWTEALA